MAPIMPNHMFIGVFCEVTRTSYGSIFRPPPDTPLPLTKRDAGLRRQRGVRLRVCLDASGAIAITPQLYQTDSVRREKKYPLACDPKGLT